jgi:hypothetical protein
MKDTAEFLSVTNDGPNIIETNFWRTDYNEKGKFYLSANASAFRLLVPLGYENAISEMLTAKEVVITNGWHRQLSRDMVEVMFDDNTDSPFALWLSIAQTDNRVADNAQKDFDFLVYTWGCSLAVRFKANWRRGSLPCLKRFSSSRFGR